MLRRSSKPLLLLILTVLILMSLKESFTSKLRGAAVAAFTPAWSGISQLKEGVSSHSSEFSESDVQQLLLENDQLQQQIEYLQELLQQELNVQVQLVRSQNLYEKELEKNPFLQRRYDELTGLLQYQMQSIPARVVFRGASSWNSSLWIDVGSESNERLGHIVVAKNSPVTVGLSVVGVVDYVGRSQSRVRLITDSGLAPSVRAARGHLQDAYLEHHIDALIASLRVREDLFQNQKDNQILIQNLEFLKQNLAEKSGGWMLAKGELHGSSQPLWRSGGQLLRGIGFNYDYSDEEGAARNLSVDQAVNPSKAQIPLLKVNDLLVTTGMDGVFPAGLHVAEVVRIDPLKEGGYFYNLFAKPTAGNLDDLKVVFVLPPVDCNSTNQVYKNLSQK